MLIMPTGGSCICNIGLFIEISIRMHIHTPNQAYIKKADSIIQQGVVYLRFTLSSLYVKY